jgi:hypothetical protein
VDSNNQIYALFDWVLNLKPGHLPPVPWKLRKCETVTGNEKFLTSLQRDIMLGPEKNSRFKTGALQEDVILLWNNIGNGN